MGREMWGVKHTLCLMKMILLSDAKIKFVVNKVVEVIALPQ